MGELAITLLIMTRSSCPPQYHLLYLSSTMRSFHPRCQALCTYIRHFSSRISRLVPPLLHLVYILSFWSSDPLSRNTTKHNHPFPRLALRIYRQTTSRRRRTASKDTPRE